MKKVFLKNGQEAELIKKIDDNNYLVEPIFMYQDEYDGDWYEDSGKREVVDKVFTSAPVAKIEQGFEECMKKYEALKKTVSLKEKELFTAQQEIRGIEKTKLDLKKLIINKAIFKAAKRITVFEDGRFTPIDVTCKKREFKMYAEIHFWNEEPRFWAYEWRFDDWSCSKKLDDKNILFDKTDEEILIIAKERVKKLCSSKGKESRIREIKRCPDEYLPKDILDYKNELLGKDKEEQIKKAEQKRKEASEELEKLKN